MGDEADRIIQDGLDTLADDGEGAARKLHHWIMDEYRRGVRRQEERKKKRSPHRFSRSDLSRDHWAHYVICGLERRKHWDESGNANHWCWEYRKDEISEWTHLWESPRNITPFPCLKKP